ncbi:MAG: TIGR02996 domain-containing protein [Kofleriaceae bacterium]
MLPDDTLFEAVRALFPIAGSEFSVELVGDDLLVISEDGLAATLRLVIRQRDGTIRDVKEQTPILLPHRHRTERGLAFLAITARWISGLATEAVEPLMPGDLFVPAILDFAPLEPAVVVRVLSDPRARTILARRPGDTALAATLDPQHRPNMPVLSNPELEARILERIDDRELYAVYGDWLAERGDPRGELIAIQLALEANPIPELRAREAALLDEHAYEWLGGFAWAPLRELGCVWRHGFLTSIRIGNSEVGGGRSIDFPDSAYEIRELARLPHAAFIQSLDIQPTSLWNTFEAIGLHGISATTLSICSETEELGDVEPAYPGLARLGELRLEGRALRLGSIVLPALRSLEIVTRGLTRDNLVSMRMAAWPALERLVLWLGEPDLDGCDIALDDLDWILAADNLHNVRHLGLCGREPAALLASLADAPILRQLHTLDLAGSFLDDAGARLFRDRAAAFAHLRAIHLPRGLRDEPEVSGLTDLGPHVFLDARFVPAYE